MWISRCPRTVCWRTSFLFHWTVLTPFLEICWPYKSLFLGSLFYCIDLYFDPYAVLHYLNYCSFIVSFEIRKYEFSNFVLIFKSFEFLCFFFKFSSVLCISTWMLGSASQFLQIKAAEILTRIVLNLLINLGSIAILSSLQINEQELSFYLFRSSLISFNDALQFSVYKSFISF